MVMLYLILILFFIAIIAGYISANRITKPISNNPQDNVLKKQSVINCNDYYIGQKVISLSARKGYQKFQIAGVYYRNLSVKLIGKFNGYAKAETDNEYDPYAIAIYNDSDTHLGYLPRGNEKLHSYIMMESGKVHAYGYLGYNNEMYGEVCVESNKDLVTQRNKPYNIN